MRSVSISGARSTDAALLGIPDHVTQAALLPVAYTKGTEFQIAKRLPAARVTHWDAW